jgi:hypothetical protein
LRATINHPQGTALVANTTTQVIDAQVSTANMQVEPTGEITGIVRRENGEIVVNLTVQLRGTSFLRAARTDTSGRFTFTDVPASRTFTVETFDQTTNTAASESVGTTADVQVTRDLTLTTGATVTGLITNPANQPVVGAQVTIQTTGGRFTGTTGADGRYQFERITLGNVQLTVVDPATNLRGRAAGSIGLSGEVLTLNARLSASGTVTGTIFRAGGTTPAANIEVALYTSLPYGSLIGRATTDAQGQYTVDLVPVGNFTVDATDPSNGDRGRTSNQVNANGETRTINFTMNGLGRVRITVTDAAGSTLDGAQVTLSSQSQFGGSQQGITGADGTLVFERVFAGNFSVTARNVNTRLAGSVNGSVTAGATTNITVAMQPAGTILGRVLGTDGTTPVTGRTVRLTQQQLLLLGHTGDNERERRQLSLRRRAARHLQR